ncbi:amidohydrolase family protein [Variovorax sp. HJSM1_2]|uniref:amidohydrolase family protein n=1 Tax=Variovorax sp. HJSM1_2 TaxID=3366263 RepID=UPI003BED3A7B
MTTPPLACDCHIHIFEDGHPLAASASFQPPHAPVSAYRRVQQALGLQRAVVVQPTGYGNDHDVLLRALEQFGEHARGVVVLTPEQQTEEQLKALQQRGVRGIRYMLLAPGQLGWDTLEATAARIAPLGWHINLQLDGRTLPEHLAVLQRLPCRLVIDHTGKFLEPVGMEHPGFQALLQLLEAGNCWVKLSAPYETSKTGAPDYADVSLLARTLAQRFPERCLWASNWPHPNRQPLPSDTALLGLLQNWAASAEVREKILLSNPAEIYGFAR